MGSTALVRAGHDHDHHEGDSDHHDRQVVYVHNHHINNDIDVTFEGEHVNVLIRCHDNASLWGGMNIYLK